MRKSREQIRRELNELTNLKALVEELVQDALARLLQADPEERPDPFDLRPYTPFTLLGYKTGVKAKLTSERQRLLRAIWKADLALEFSQEEYETSGAGDFGDPLSPERLEVMVWHLRCQASFQAKKGNHDSAHHFETDAAYLKVLEERLLGGETE